MSHVTQPHLPRKSFRGSISHHPPKEFAPGCAFEPAALEAALLETGDLIHRGCQTLPSNFSFTFDFVDR